MLDVVLRVRRPLLSISETSVFCPKISGDQRSLRQSVALGDFHLLRIKMATTELAEKMKSVDRRLESVT